MLHPTANHWSDRDARVGGGTQPSQRLGAIFGFGGIGDIRLNHAHCAPARTLHDARQEQQPQTVGVGEYHIRDGTGTESHHQGRSPSVTIGESTPDGCADKLRDAECTHQQPNNQSTAAKAFRIEGQQWQDHQQTKHVDESCDHQHGELSECALLGLARWMFAGACHLRLAHSDFPSAAGATLRPTTPANAMMVSR